MTDSEDYSEPGDRAAVWAKAGRNVALIAGVLAFAVALAVATYSVVVIRQTQQTNAPKIDRTDDTLQAVKDLAEDINSCTNPKGACARRGQRNTGKAIDTIALRQVAAVACGDQPGTQSNREIQACVTRTLRVIDETGP